MVKLAPEQQAMVVAAEPALFSPAKGAWGKAGATVFQLRNADPPTIRSGLDMAWTNQKG